MSSTDTPLDFMEPQDQVAASAPRSRAVRSRGTHERKRTRSVTKQAPAAVPTTLPAVIPPPTPPAVDQKPSMKIPPGLIERARQRPVPAWIERYQNEGPAANLYNSARHPPGVRPAGGMAMDSKRAKDVARWAMDELVIQASTSYAGNAINSVWAEGVTFMGYAFLSELAQRPEYRAITDITSTELTRKWGKLKSTAGEQDNSERITQLTEEMDRLKVRDTFRDAAALDSFFGRGHIYVDLGTTDDRAELMTPIGDGWNDISALKVTKGSLKRLKTVEPVWTYPARYNSIDPLAPDWYRPEHWYVQAKQMHSSRLLTFVGREVPDLLKPAYSFGGISMTQMAKPYVDNWLRTRQAVADLIWSFSVSGVLTDMATSLQNDGAGLFDRLQLFNALRNNQGCMVLNKDTEEFFNVSTPLGSLDSLQGQSQEHMAAVCRIPIVKLLGIQPMGLNASSEGEIRTFYDHIAAFQEKLFTDNLHRVTGFAMRNIWGAVDPTIVFEFENLWSLDEKGEADVRKIDAETGTILIDSGVISREEERKRVALSPDTPYHSLDVNELPDLEQEEEQGLEPGGGMGEGGGEGSGTEEERDDATEAADDAGEVGQRPVIPFAGAGDEGPFEEGKHPRVHGGENSGQFAPKGGGGGSSGGEGGEKEKAPAEAPAAHGSPAMKTYKNYTPSETGEQHHAKTLITLSKPAVKSTTYRWMIKQVIKQAEQFGMPQFVPSLKMKIAESWQKEHAGLSGKGMTAEADKVMDKIKTLLAEAGKKSGGLPPAMSIAPIPAKHVEAAKAAQKSKASKATAAEIEQAKKTTPVPMSISQGKDVNQVKPLVQAFNKKYEGKSLTATGDLEQKVADFKKLKADIDALKAPDQSEKLGLTTPEAKASFKDLAGVTGNEYEAASYVEAAQQKLAYKPPSIETKINAADAAHIVCYTGTGYAKVNNALRNGAMTPQVWQHAVALNNALDQLPPFVGETRRGSTMPASELAKYEAGMVVEERGFTSTSKNQGFQKSVRFTIHSKTGRDISWLSGHQGEGEVLFKAGTRFLVKEHKTVGPLDMHHITMHEV